MIQTATNPNDAATELSRDETLRYARHLILPEVGPDGQRQLKASRVLLVGAGGLGSPAAMYLAAAGLGTLGMVDFDVVDATNLQRQILHHTPDIGRLKLDSARERIAGINPNVEFRAHPERLTSDNALGILAEYDLVVDGSDNFPTRYLVNDACVLSRRPYVYGSIFRFDGQLSVFAAEGGPCYRCLFSEPPPPGLVPSCAEGGVLGVLPGIVGSLQAMETIKLLLGIGEPMIGRLLMFDALRMQFRELRLRRDPECPACGDHPTVRELIDYEHFCGITQPGGEKPMSDQISEISPTELKQRVDRGDDVVIVDVREPYEWEMGNLEPYGAKLIPLAELPERLDEVEKTDEIVLMCRSGGRSEKALKLLREQGFDRLHNLSGGILAWSDEIDPSIPKY